MRIATLIVTAILVSILGAVATGGHGDGLETFKSRHYNVHTNLEPRSARDVAKHMDAVYAEFTRRFKGFNPRNNTRSNLYLFADEEDYLIGLARKGINATNSGGMFFWSSDGDEGLATWVNGKDTSRLWHVLQHEGFHQFAFLRLGDDVPPWVNEGVAEYFGHGLLIRGRLKLGLVPEGRLMSVVEAIKRDEHIPFRTLIRMTQERWNARLSSGHPDAGLQYSQSWAVAHFLVHARGGRYEPAFNRYLKLVAAGRQSERAFEEVFGSRDLQPFEDAWIDFMLELEPDPISAATERLEFMAEGMRSLDSGGVDVVSVEELKRRLRDDGFLLLRYEHGAIRSFSSDDDRYFEAPPTDVKRKTSELIFNPPEAPGLPPSIEVLNLRVPVRLTWSRDAEKRLVYDIQYQ